MGPDPAPEPSSSSLGQRLPIQGRGGDPRRCALLRSEQASANLSDGRVPRMTLLRRPACAGWPIASRGRRGRACSWPGQGFPSRQRPRSRARTHLSGSPLPAWDEPLRLVMMEGALTMCRSARLRLWRGASVRRRRRGARAAVRARGRRGGGGGAGAHAAGARGDRGPVRRAHGAQALPTGREQDPCATRSKSIRRRLKARRRLAHRRHGAGRAPASSPFAIGTPQQPESNASPICLPTIGTPDAPSHWRLGFEPAPPPTPRGSSARSVRPAPPSTW